MQEVQDQDKGAQHANHLRKSVLQEMRKQGIETSQEEVNWSLLISLENFK